LEAGRAALPTGACHDRTKQKLCQIIERNVFGRVRWAVPAMIKAVSYARDEIPLPLLQRGMLL
jgi:hypothetical protein